MSSTWERAPRSSQNFCHTGLTSYPDLLDTLRCCCPLQNADEKVHTMHILTWCTRSKICWLCLRTKIMFWFRKWLSMFGLDTKHTQLLVKFRGKTYVFWFGKRFVWEMTGDACFQTGGELRSTGWRSCVCVPELESNLSPSVSSFKMYVVLGLSHLKLAQTALNWSDKPFCVAARCQWVNRNNTSISDELGMWTGYILMNLYKMVTWILDISGFSIAGAKHK